MSNDAFFLLQQINIYPNVTVNLWVNLCRLAFTFDDFNFVKASTEKIGK